MTCDWCGEDSPAAFWVGDDLVCYGCGRDAEKAAAYGDPVGAVVRITAVGR